MFLVKQLPEEPIFLCMSRLIKSKGLIEYARNYPGQEKKIFEFIDSLLKNTGKVGEYDQKI